MCRVMTDTEEIKKAVREEVPKIMWKWLLGTGATFLIFLAGALWQASAWQSGMSYRVSELERRSLETATISNDVATMKSDISWIKQQMIQGNK